MKRIIKSEQDFAKTYSEGFQEFFEKGLRKYRGNKTHFLASELYWDWRNGQVYKMDDWIKENGGDKFLRKDTYKEFWKINGGNIKKYILKPLANKKCIIYKDGEYFYIRLRGKDGGLQDGYLYFGDMFFNSPVRFKTYEETEKYAIKNKLIVFNDLVW